MVGVLGFVIGNKKCRCRVFQGRLLPKISPATLGNRGLVDWLAWRIMPWLVSNASIGMISKFARQEGGPESGRPF